MVSLKNLYPGDYHRAFIEEFTMRMVTPGNLIIVLEVDVGDERVEGRCGRKEDFDKRNTADSGAGQEQKRQEADDRGVRKITAYAVFVKHGPKKESLLN